ncbi:MAG: DNA methyltransferase [Pseudomonadota bacterium]
MIGINEIGERLSEARTHSDADIEKLAASIREFDWVQPILLTDEKQVIAGWARIQAAERLGQHEVPALRLTDLTEEEAKAYAIADNKHAENASWDKTRLAMELKATLNMSASFSVEALGFSDSTFKMMTSAAVDTGALAERLDAAMLAGPAVSRAGDLWILGRHRIKCGDAKVFADLDKLMGEKMARMVFTDPPYNVPVHGHVSGNGAVRHAEFAEAAGEMSPDEFRGFLSGVLSNVEEFSLDGSLHYVCMDWRGLSTLLDVGEMVFDALMNMAVWVKPNGGMGSFYRSQHELIPIFKKGGAAHVNNVQLGAGGRNRTNVWKYAPPANALKLKNPHLKIHPTVKPTEMIRDAIFDATHAGDIVLDVFLGSGSTLLAAEHADRRCFGLEIEPRYVDLAIRRWQAFTGEPAKLEGSGKTFRELEAERAEIAEAGDE